MFVTTGTKVEIKHVIYLITSSHFFIIEKLFYLSLT